MILVDTCIWSLALRRNRKDLSAYEQKLVFTLRDLIVRGDACVVGPIRQELLSGVTSERQFHTLQKQISLQIELPLGPDTWDLAAEYFNTCKAAGVAPDAVDMTICSAASAHGASIFTVDPDFVRYGKKLPIILHQVQE